MFYIIYIMEEICSICKKVLSNRKGLSFHLKNTHKFTKEQLKEYYDTNFKVGENLCACGNPARFKSLYEGYYTQCSSCIKRNGYVKMKKTINDKYGVDNISSLQFIKDKKIKTIREHYGVDNYMQSNQAKEQFKKLNPFNNPEVQKNIQKSNTIKYGGKSPMCSKTVRSKSKITLLNKYGVDHAMKNKDICNKAHYNIRKNALYNLNNNLHDMFGITITKQHNDNYFDIHCNRCNRDYIQIHKQTLTRNLFRNHTPCPHCGYKNPYRSQPEIDIYNFIKSIYNKTVITNCKHIGGIEFDIVIPDKKICIEYNGLYWHSELYRDKTFHLDKKQIALDNGYNCIFIWEDDWLNNQIVIKNRLSLILSQEKSLHARKCKFEFVQAVDVKELLLNNHIQGFAAGSLYSVLKYNQEIVSIMVFGKNRFETSNKSIELIRYCPIKNIMGGFDKLLINSIKEIQNRQELSSITTYCDLDWSGIQNNIYSNHNFQEQGYTEQWWYTKSQQRFNRLTFTKQKMIKLLNRTDLSTQEMISILKLNRVWGCGNKKYSYTI